MRRPALLALLVPLLIVGLAAPANACAGLIGPNGSVELLRTSTLAAHADGVEHYVTSFEFAGGGAELGSLVPLPGVPTKVEKGGRWTLQRLREELPVEEPLFEASADDADAAAALSTRAEVLHQTRIDALDITVLRGGGDAVGTWARENGFRLTPDAPEVLDFYAERSPIFLAARFDATAARARGQQVGQGTPVHLTIPLDEPWVPLRILALGRDRFEVVEADVFLLTERRPSLLAGGEGLTLDLSTQASDELLADLRSDRGMDWMPEDMWLSHLALDADAEDLDYDLAVATRIGTQPSVEAAGVDEPRAIPPVTDTGAPAWVTGLLVFIAAMVGVGGLALVVATVADRQRVPKS